MNAQKIERLIPAAKQIIIAARRDGITVDNGNVVDLLLDNMSALRRVSEARLILASDEDLSREFATACAERNR